MATQKDSAKIDPLTGMPHSEAHYFNRFAAAPCVAALPTMNDKSLLTGLCIATTTMVRLAEAGSYHLPNLY